MPFDPLRSQTISSVRAAAAAAPKTVSARRGRARVGGILLLALWLPGCATYSPVPLDQKPDLVKNVAALKIDPRSLPVRALRRYPFNPKDGLDMTEVAMLAVVNNPNLKATRRKANVARAQLFDARLLPDPMISSNLSKILSCNTAQCAGPGNITGFGGTLNYNLLALITRGARIDSASYAKVRVDLDILWSEWQTAQQARRLYVRAVYQLRKIALLKHVRKLYSQRYAFSANALKQGNLTMDVVGTDLTGLLEANTRLNQANQQENLILHNLNSLLGLSPTVTLNLVQLDEPRGPPVDEALVKTLPQRRPDLVALRAGYRSQEANVRKAVLSQFPSISAGVTRARGNGGLNTIGFNISLTLPVFNRNRGKIAIQRATRSQLRQEYTARLDTTHVQIDMLERQYAIIEQQLKRVKRNLPKLENMVDYAQRAYQAGNINSLIYLNMQFGLINKQIEKIDLEKTLWDTRIALDTLVGWTKWEQ